MAPAADRGWSAVGQIVLFDLIAVGLEQHGGAAQLADLLLGALDHAVTLAGLLVEHHPGRGHLEALFGAGFGLELGHLALLCGGRHGPAGCARLSVLITVATAALFGRAAEGRRYGRGDREIQPEPGPDGCFGPRRLKEAKGRQVFGVPGLRGASSSGRQVFRRGPSFGALARRAALTAAPTPSQPGGLRSAAPARPWRLWRCRP